MAVGPTGSRNQSGFGGTHNSCLYTANSSSSREQQQQITAICFQQQQQQQQRRLWGSSSRSSSNGAGDSLPWGSTAAHTATTSSSSSSSSSLAELHELRHQEASLNAAESILSSLRCIGSSWGVKKAAAAAAGAAPAGGGAAAGGVGRAQLRHFSDLLLSAHSELADVSASLEATLRESGCWGGPI
ncbi:hypothetical protein ACSSS7_006807 [Eimeria intestinalis]